MKKTAFKISNPDEYDCMVRKFDIGHSTMHVQVRHKVQRQQFFYVVFSSVEYFSGSMRWGGADFYIKSDEEMLSVIRKVERLNQTTEEKLLASPPYRLYEVVTSNDIIQIIARRASIQSDKID